MKKRTIMMMATVLAVSACSMTALAAKDSLKIAIAIDCANYSPNGQSGEWPAHTLGQIYDNLFFLKDDGSLEMKVAESVEMEDPSHCLIKIRDDVKDTAGRQIKASDVLFSIKLAKEGTAGYPGATRSIDIENSEVIDDYTLRLAYSAPNSYQKNALSLVNLVNQETYEESEDQMVTTPVASGPYKLTEYVPGAHMIMEANEDYWDGAPEIKGLTVNFVNEDSQRTNVLLTGEVDVAYDVPSIDVDYLSGTDGIVVDNITSINTVACFFNCSGDSVTSNKELRKAIAYAINKQALVESAYSGLAQSAKTAVSPNLSDYDAEWEKIFDGNYAYDVEKAKEHMAASGVKEGTAIKLITSGGTIMNAVGEIIQANLAEIGLTVEISTYPDTILEVIPNQPEVWDMALNNWTNYPARSALAQINTFIANGNFVHAEGELYDNLLAYTDGAISAADDTEKADYMTKLMTAMYDEVPVYGLYNIPVLIGRKENLEMGYKTGWFYWAKYCKWNE